MSFVIPVMQSSFFKNDFDTPQDNTPKTAKITKEINIPILKINKQQLSFLLAPIIPKSEISIRKTPKQIVVYTIKSFKLYIFATAKFLQSELNFTAPQIPNTEVPMAIKSEM